MFALLITQSNDDCVGKLRDRAFFNTIEEAEIAARDLDKQFEFCKAHFKPIKLTSSICKRYRADRNARFPELLNKDVI